MTEPVLTAAPGNGDIDNGIVVNGDINIRRTHPNLYWLVMTAAVTMLLLAANFYWLNPTFEVYHLSNYVWATIFLALGTGEIVFLNIYRSLRWVRRTMACAFGFLMFFAFGTGEPWWDGQGSLQLTIVYAYMMATQVPLLFEPFIQPFTARRG